MKKDHLVKSGLSVCFYFLTIRMSNLDVFFNSVFISVYRLSFVNNQPDCNWESLE